MKKILLLSILLCTFTLTATQAQNGIYAGLEGGIGVQSGLPSKEDIYATDMSVSRTLNSFRASVGYNHDLYSFLGIGLEVGFGQYGDTTYRYPDGATTRVVSRTLEFLPVFTFHVNEKFDLFTKLGGARLTPITSGRNATERRTKNYPQAAIGAAYNFTPKLAATFTVSRVFADDVEAIRNLDGNQGPTINATMLGVRYSFGS